MDFDVDVDVDVELDVGMDEDSYILKWTYMLTLMWLWLSRREIFYNFTPNIQIKSS